MPKSKQNARSFNLSTILIVIFTAFILVGGYLYSIMERTSINYIGEKGIVMPSTSPSPNSCQTVSTLSLTNSCGKDSYRTISYTCGLNLTLGSRVINTTCKSYDTLYKEAQSSCLSTCASPSPIDISTSVTYLTPAKPRLYYGLFNGYLHLSVTRANGESSFYVLRSSQFVSYLDLSFITNPKETLSIKVYTSQEYTGNSSQLSIGWIAPLNNTCGRASYAKIDITNFLSKVKSSAPNQQIISTQCWSDYNSSGIQDFNDFVFVWTNVGYMNTQNTGGIIKPKFSPTPVASSTP